jgi:hypothetical protein
MLGSIMKLAQLLAELTMPYRLTDKFKINEEMQDLFKR